MKKEDYKDKGLRQALQRRNETAERMMLPEDFTDRLMERLEKPLPQPLPREGRTRLLRWVASAACLLIIIGVGMTLLPKEELAKTEQPRPQQPAPAQREGRIKSLPLRGDWRGLPVAKSETASQRPTRTPPTPQTPPPRSECCGFTATNHSSNRQPGLLYRQDRTRTGPSGRKPLHRKDEQGDTC